MTEQPIVEQVEVDVQADEEAEASRWAVEASDPEGLRFLHLGG